LTGERWSFAWFERAHTPSIILERSLTVVALNQAARDFLSSSGDLLARGDVLVCQRREDQGRLQTFMGGLTEGESRSVFIGRALLIGTMLGEDGPAGLNIRDTDLRNTLDCADLEEAFGVTQAERTVLLLTINGRSPVEIARQLDNSVLTIRTHTKRLYAKLGVQTKEQMFERIIPYLFISRRTW
jgi:DNA-binding CsgD family transcriptional regulator